MATRVPHIFIDGVEHKKCCRCKEVKIIDDYSIRSSAWDNCTSSCKSCMVKDRKKRKSQIRESNKLYWKKRKTMTPPMTPRAPQVFIKKCAQCKEEKPVERFGKRTVSKDGFEARCKKCYNLHNRERYKSDPKLRSKDSIRRKKNYYENRTYELKRNKIYRQSNPEKRREWRREKQSNDMEFVMLGRCRARLAYALKSCSKSATTRELLGCDGSQLCKYLESKFQDGMNWENRNQWHIDHIVPCNAFDFTMELDQRICFWYKNLQPMWGPENYAKGDKYEEEDKLKLINEYLNSV